MLKRLLAYSKVAIPLLLGICIGVALSFIVLPFLEEQNCEWNPTLTEKNIKTSVGSRYDYLTNGIDWDSFRHKEFEPRIIKSPQSEQQTVKKPIRHRFASSEMDIKDTLFIGYLSTTETAKFGKVYALDKAISRPHNNKEALKFFLDVSHNRAHLGEENIRDFPSLVSLNLLDSKTLPLLSVKYINTNTQNYNIYKYYMLVPDTVYVLTSSITAYLQQLQGEHFMGFSSSADSATCDPALGFIISQVIGK